MKLSSLLILAFIFVWETPAIAQNDSTVLVCLKTKVIGERDNYTSRISDLVVFSFIDEPAFQVYVDTITGVKNIPGYLVNGTIYARKQEFVLDFNVTDKSQTTHQIPSVICSSRDIYDNVNRQAKKIIQQIKLLESNRKNNVKVVFLPAGSNKEAQKFKRLFIDISQAQKSSDQVRYIPWETSSKYSYKKIPDKTIFDETGADAILRISFQMIDGLSVEPELVLRGDVNPIKLPSILLHAYTDEAFSHIRDDLNSMLGFLAADTIGTWNQAHVAKLKEALADSPEQPIQKKAKTYFNKEEWLLSSTLCYKAIGQHLKDPEIYQMLTFMLLMQKQYDQAEFFAQRGLKYSPSNTQMLYFSGLSSLEIGQYKTALVAFQAVKKSTPDYRYQNFGHIDVLMGRAYFASDSTTQAINILETYLTHNNDKEALYYLGKCYTNVTGQGAKAVDAFSKVYQMDTAFHDIKISLAQSRYILALEKSQIKDYKTAIELLGRIPTSLWDAERGVLLVNSYLRVQDFKKADSAITALTNMKCFDPQQVYKTFASITRVIYDENGQSPEYNLYAIKVREYLNKHLTINPTDASGLWLMGSILVSQHEFMPAYKFLKRAYDIDTTSMLVRLDLAEASIMIGNYKDVYQIINKKYVDQYKHLQDKSIHILMLYLRSTAYWCLADGAIRIPPDLIGYNKEYDVLANLLKKEKTISGWYYNAFEYWVDKHNFKSTDTQEKIKNLTARMKSLTRN